MSDLDEMWTALEEYQPFADKRGFGEAWKQMCRERTPDTAAGAATEAVNVACYAPWKAAAAAVFAVVWGADSAKGSTVWQVWSQRAINNIREAIERERLL